MTVMQSAKSTIPVLLQAFENLKLINQHKETDTISFLKTLPFSIFIDKWSSRPRRTFYNLSFLPLKVTHRKITIAVTQSTFMSETTQGVFPSQTLLHRHAILFASFFPLLDELKDEVWKKKNDEKVMLHVTQKKDDGSMKNNVKMITKSLWCNRSSMYYTIILQKYSFSFLIWNSKETEPSKKLKTNFT